MPHDAAARKTDAPPLTSPPDPAAVALGILVSECGVCIGRPSGCRVSALGMMWCGSRHDHLPGHRIVGHASGLTGYRRLSAVPPSPDTRGRLATWLDELGAEAELQVAELRAKLAAAEGGVA
jgi:hypothetical protein